MPIIVSSTGFELIASDANSGSVFRQWLKGVERARGDYVWIAEADDLSDPGFLAAVLAPLQQDPAVVMSYCQSSAIDADGQTLAADYRAYTDDLSTRRWLEGYRATGAQEVDAGLAIKNTVPNVSAAVFRRADLLAVLQAEIEDISSYRIAGDWVAYLRLLQRGRIAFSPDVLNHHRRHDASVTMASNRLLHLREVLRAQKLARDTYRVDAATLAKARDYARTLYQQFGLGDAAAPRLELHPQLCGLLDDAGDIQQPLATP